MALSRYNATSGLLIGSRQGKENMEGLIGKGTMAKNKPAQRGALGNISNAAKMHTMEPKKGLKDATNGLPKAGRVASKQTIDVDKENVGATTRTGKQEIQKDDDQMVQSPVKEITDAFSKKFLNVEDIDKDDVENPQLVSVYVNDIYNYMRDLEGQFPVRHHYLEGAEINGRMRGILTDWLVQVHLRFHLLQETLYLTVAIIDRFLQIQTVARSKLQLVGVTAMLIASKYEEMYAPEIADFVYITDNAYTKADIRRTECIILGALDFNLGRPLPLHFLRRNSKAGEVDATQHTLAKYLMELTITDYEMVDVFPSMIAASALCLSMKVLNSKGWNDTLEFYSKYSEQELRPIMERMSLLVTKAGTGKLTAIKTKYQSSKFMRISQIPELTSQVILDYASSAQNNTEQAPK